MLMKIFTKPKELVILLTLFLFIGANAQVFEDVIVRDNLYSKSDDNSLYRCTTYNIFTTNLDYLDTVMVDADVNFINVYYFDASNQSYSLHGVAGKSLKNIFNGDNDESQVVDINSLRDNYNEWFVREDSTAVLVNLNLVARHNFLPEEKVTITENLLNENTTGTQYNTTAYFVKSFADMNILDTIIIGANKDWLNIYVKNNSENGDPFQRRDIMNVAGQSLKTILEANNLTIDSLYFDYKEWFKDANDDSKLVKLNIKAVEELGTVPVSIYPDLFANGEHDSYSITGYKVKQSATMTDLENITILASDVDFISIFKDKLIGYERINVDITVDITLKEILENNGIAIADLKDNYKEWFSKEDGLPTLKNINVKASKIVGSLPVVTKRDSLYSSGSNEYRNIAYYVNSNASLSDLENYTLNGDGGLNIYLTAYDGSDSIVNIPSTAGLTIREVFENNNITVSDLRNDYVEWFKDYYGKPALVKLNIKEKYSLPDAEKIAMVKNLYSREGAYFLENYAYYVKESADIDDLDSKILSSDIDWVNVYCNVNDIDTVYRLTGVAGLTLKKALMATWNNENIDIDYTTLKKNNLAWYKTNQNEWVLIKVNIETNKIYQTLNVINIDNQANKLNIYPNPVTNVLNVSVENNLDFKYSIYNSKGDLVKTGLSNNKVASIDVTEIARGMYILKIVSNENTYTAKFIK